jgi:hypothetical protein
MGLRKRLVIPQIEVVSDKQDGVLVIMHDENKATIIVRKPWESTWNATGPTFTIDKKDVPVITAAMAGGDAEWTMRDRAITTSTFEAPDINEEAVAKEVEARCSQLDIERAKAANIAEEKDLLTQTLVVQHMDDKHIREYVSGCPKCEASVRTMYDVTDEDLVDEPFRESMPSVDADDL